MEIALSHCRLRSLRPEDAASLAHHGNDREVWKTLRDRFPHPYTRADAEHFITHIAVGPNEVVFGIEVDGMAVGSVSLVLGQDVERLSAELGYWLGKRFWGRGIMTEVVEAVTDYAVRHRRLARIFAVPFATNAASARLLEKVGYVLEGRLKHSAIKEGVLIDQLLYAYVPSEAFAMDSQPAAPMEGARQE